MAVFRKKPTSVIRTSASKPELSRNWFIFLKPLLVLLCVTLLYLFLTNWGNFLEKLDQSPIRAYALTHQPRYTTNEDIREQLGKEPALKGYFSQDIQEVKDKLLGMPWVKEVSVRKIYPDKLSITLFEHRPVAVWNNQQLLSENGTVFQLPKSRVEEAQLPILVGPDDKSKQVLDAWAKIQQDLSTRGLGLRSVAIDNRGSWTIMLDNSVELRLGRGEWLPKIDRFVAIFPDIAVPEGKRLSYVDLRYEHGASVGFSNK